MGYYSGICPICGKSFDRYARSDKRFCGATCRKRNERKQKNHEKEKQKVIKWLYSLEKDDLRELQAIISQRLQNI